MRNYYLQLTVLLMLFSVLSFETEAQRKKKGSKEAAPAKKETPYEKITKGAKVDEGLFTVFQNGDKYYYEIPTDYLDTDMLWVSRISKIPQNFGGGYINAGTKTNEQVVQWSIKNKSVLLRSVSYYAVASDSLPINESVNVNNYAPIIRAFEIEATNPSSGAVVIDVTPLFMNDVPAIGGLASRMRGVYKVRNLDKSRSFIDRVASFPENIEVRHDMTFNASAPPSNSSAGTISLQMAQSMYLLPEKPMMARQYDPRVGWFTIRQIDYGSDALKADQKTYIRRWRLEPSDPEAYARGELVEPVKPIVYYLDPATPTKWRKYFKQGIEDWQVAFEAAGFKNAILAKDAPTPDEDPDWSAEDARFSTVRYVATTTRNAMGPSVSDPRSGEIIESDIVWYHNHLRSYRNRYLLETGAANPKARSLDTPEEEIGEMMRMVIAHEIGHALGLPHNMKASYAYPTDSLRSVSFTQKWGLASTLMDYTRYNYVAQPGDGDVRWVRMLGPYDSYAINWGYRWLPSVNSPADEKATLDKWIKEKEGDPLYLFGSATGIDPSSQTESVGDDPVLASTYGLANLKIVAANLVDWTTDEGDNYADLAELYGELAGVWSRYAGHVATNIGGIYQNMRTSDQAGITYTPIDKAEQQKSMKFMVDHVFSTPTWMLREEILRNISYTGAVDNVRRLQNRQLGSLLSSRRLKRLIENEAMNGSKAYTLTEMMSDLRNGIWSELSAARDIDAYRRNLQKSHVEYLMRLIDSEKQNRTDISSVARAELNTIRRNANSAANRYRSGINRYHLQDVAAMIDGYLEE